MSGIIPAYNPAGSIEEYANKLSLVIQNTQFLDPEDQPLLAQFANGKQMLQCALCMDYFESSVVIHHCGQMICASHLNLRARSAADEKEGCHECMHCRTPYQYPHRPTELVLYKDLLNDLLVECSNCRKQMKQSLFEHHYTSECVYSCPISSECSVKLTWEPMIDHLVVECAYKQVKYIGKEFGCDWKGSVSEYKEKHYETCNYKEIYNINQTDQIDLGNQNTNYQQQTSTPMQTGQTMRPKRRTTALAIPAVEKTLPTSPFEFVN